MPRHAWTTFAAAGLAGLATAGSVAATPRDASYFTNLPLIAHSGEEVRFYDELIEDRIVAISFIYTDCPDLCSLSTARLAQVYDWLGDKMGRDIFFYSISLTPETDTPEKLARFAEAFGVGDGWLFLTGQAEDIDTIRHRLGERSRSLSEHRSDMVIGNDRTGHWRRSSVMGNLGTVMQSILELDPDWVPDDVGAAGDAPAAYGLDGHPGEALFLQGCAACHSIGAGTRIGPDLAGVTLRRERAWLRRYIAAPDILLRDGDPVAVALDARFPDVRMPFMDLSPTDIEDLLAYLQAEFEELTREGGRTTADHAHPDHAAHDHAVHAHAAPSE